MHSLDKKAETNGERRDARLQFPIQYSALLLGSCVHDVVPANTSALLRSHWLEFRLQGLLQVNLPSLHRINPAILHMP